jgi:hypothetical protein
MSTSLSRLLAEYSASIPTPTPYQGARWIAVRRRFEQFHGNIVLTPSQELDGYQKRAGVIDCLNRHYYGASVNIENSFLIGSWGKTTTVRPPRDVDVYFLLPAAVYFRFQPYLHNRQSALLQEVKGVLSRTYPSTEMRGDGQVVVVRFSTYNVEIVPAFALDTGRYLICDANNGGRYKEANPWAEVRHIEAADGSNAGNLRPLIRMMKVWQKHCSVPIKSFHLELLAAEFLAQSLWRLNDYFYFDWLLRDFFAYLCSRANSFVVVPETGEVIFVGDDWYSRVESAYHRAVKACDFEQGNYVVSAGGEWQKIFGLDIPLTV